MCSRPRSTARGWPRNSTPSTAGWTDLTNPEFAGFIAAHDGCVVGGTGWDFANANKIPRLALDLLVVEEAGQYSLANTIAVAPSARNLMLLGDPQQLPQVSQGTHPEPVNESALGWLVEGHHTLPVERGYFLDYSYRMHPAVCDPVSRLSYDGRLRSHENVSAARRLDGVAARCPGADRRRTTATPPTARKRPTRSSPRSAGCSAPRGPTNTARLPWLKNTCSW